MPNKPIFRNQQLYTQTVTFGFITGVKYNVRIGFVLILYFCIVYLEFCACAHPLC